MSLASLPRQVVAVLLAVALCESHRFAGATYRGLRIALGFGSDKGVRKAVSAAQALGAVTINQTPRGPGTKAVIRLTPPARAALSAAGLHPAQRQEQHP